MELTDKMRDEYDQFVHGSDCGYEEDDYDHCYECQGYGNDYYYDEELDEWLSNCDDCPFNNLNDWEDD